MSGHVRFNLEWPVARSDSWSPLSGKTIGQPVVAFDKGLWTVLWSTHGNFAFCCGALTLAFDSRLPRSAVFRERNSTRVPCRMTRVTTAFEIKSS